MTKRITSQGVELANDLARTGITKMAAEGTKYTLEENSLRNGIIILRYVGIYKKRILGDLLKRGEISEKQYEKEINRPPSNQRVKKVIEEIIIGTDLAIEIPNIPNEKLKIYNMILHDFNTGKLQQYDTDDGQIKWLINNNFDDINLSQFRSIIPKNIRKLMKNWRVIQLPLETAIRVRSTLVKDFESKKLKNEYGTEDGQTRWLKNNDLYLNLYNFRSIIPTEIKKEMKNWKATNLPYQEAIKKYGL